MTLPAPDRLPAAQLPVWKVWAGACVGAAAAAAAGFAGGVWERFGTAAGVVAVAAACLTVLAGRQQFAPRRFRLVAVASVVVLAGTVAATVTVWWPDGADPDVTRVVAGFAAAGSALWAPAAAASLRQGTVGAVTFAACAVLWVYSVLHVDTSTFGWVSAAVAAGVAARYARGRLGPVDAVADVGEDAT